MKTRKKVLWCILVLILIAWIVCAWLFIHNQNKIKDYSTYCMDSVRQELWEYLENVSMPNATKLDWAYIYTWSVTSEWVNYNFSCKVYSKDNVDLDLEPVYETCGWEACEIPGTPVEEAQTYTIMWPENWFDEQLEAGKLVLRWEYEDHADVIFIDQEMWQNYVDPHKMIYWDSVLFKWELVGIDWAAGTHYYNAVSIDTLEELFAVNVNDKEWEKSLVIVFSPTGHTKQIATYISEIEGSDLNELIPEIPYTAEDLDYNTNGTRANNEQNDPDARPEIATEFSLDGYDRIYIGYPIWWWTNPKIILTLIEKYDFSGKEIVLFCTSWSSGIGTSESELRGHGLNIIWSKRFAQGASKQDVQEWLESL